ncbi:MAG: PIG-L deacetylase family protein [bacterium]
MIRSEFKNILTFLAHPDDTELSAGGSIVRWVEDGAVVRVVICTNGDKGTKEDITPFRLAEIREAEQLAASKILGVKETIFLRHRDGELENTRAFCNQLAFLIRHYKPDTIVTHDPHRTHYQHPDHQAIGLATFRAIIYARDHHFLPELTHAGIGAHHTNVLLYSNTLTPNFFVDTSSAAEKKAAAICAHKSQIKNPAHTRKRVLQRGRSSGALAGLPLAEAFTITRMR